MRRHHGPDASCGLPRPLPRECDGLLCQLLRVQLHGESRARLWVTRPVRRHIRLHRPQRTFRPVQRAGANDGTVGQLSKPDRVVLRELHPALQRWLLRGGVGGVREPAHGCRGRRGSQSHRVESAFGGARVQQLHDRQRDRVPLAVRRPLPGRVHQRDLRGVSRRDARGGHRARGGGPLRLVRRSLRTEMPHPDLRLQHHSRGGVLALLSDVL
mmetsp:Transcript_56413/g.155045  ORF Transcript_56413/g.155045 Transcript_56413/m.155045 type:complete len:213 (+) Transcript_56413:2598-3236(+)